MVEPLTLPVLPGDPMKLFKIEDGERHWFVAESAQAAKAEHLDMVGEDMGPEITSIEEVAGDHVLTIRLVDEPGQPLETKTAAEWVASVVAEGCPGLIASSVW
jgi:hypothetical protein